jgi:hypothetical protein
LATGGECIGDLDMIFPQKKKGKSGNKINLAILKLMLYKD